MVKKVLKFLSFTLFFLMALMIFIPKESVYYFAEKQMKAFDVVVSNEKLTENIFSLHIKNLEISAKGVDSAVIQEADIKLLLMYNSLNFEKIQLSSVVEAYAPSNIEHIELQYTLVNPLNVIVNAKGDFGEAHASFNLLKRAANVVLKPSKRMLSNYRRTLHFFKKSQNGEYVYAKTF